MFHGIYQKTFIKKNEIDVHLQLWLSERRTKEGNVLFNDALNTFYFTVIWHQTYGKGPLR